MKYKEKIYEKYILTLSTLLLLTIFLVFHSLNRLGFNCFEKPIINYPLRILIEHLVTGFYIPLLIIFIIIFITSLYFRKIAIFNNKYQIIFFTITSIIYILGESYYQLIMNYNKQSYIQIIFSLIGIFLSWIYWNKFLKN